MLDRGYLADPAGVELVRGAAEALGTLRALGARLVLVSNQSGIARGLIRREQHVRVDERLCELLAVDGVTLDARYYCEHGPDDGCACRKPRPGMLRSAAREHDLDLAASLMVGDRDTDVAAGRAAGVRRRCSHRAGTQTSSLRIGPHFFPRLHGGCHDPRHASRRRAHRLVS